MIELIAGAVVGAFLFWVLGWVALAVCAKLDL